MTSPDDLPSVFLHEDPEKAWAELGQHFLWEAVHYGQWATPEMRSIMHLPGVTTVEQVKKSERYLILTPDELIARCSSEGPTGVRHALSALRRHAFGRRMEKRPPLDRRGPAEAATARAQHEGRSAHENRLTFDFSGTSVLVTGGTSGIGHAIASAFADAGRLGHRHRHPGARPSTTTATCRHSPSANSTCATRRRSTPWRRISTASMCWSTTPEPTFPTAATNGTRTASRPHSTSTWRAPCASPCARAGAGRQLDGRGGQRGQPGIDDRLPIYHHRAWLLGRQSGARRPHPEPGRALGRAMASGSTRSRPG